MAKVKTQENPIDSFQPRRFVCSKWPFLSVGGGVKFNAGHLTVTTEEQLARLEKADAFRAGQIVEIKQRSTRQKPSVEESAEMAALAELESIKPKARRGMVSTTNMVG